MGFGGGGAMTLGEAVVKITGDDREFDRVQRQVEGKARGMVGRLSGLLAQVGATVGKAATVATVAAAGLSITMASSFEDTFAQIAALTTTPKASIAALRDDVLDLARSIPKSPEELGSAAYFILSSGIEDAGTAMAVLESSAKAAAAGLGDTQTVASAVTSVMNAYNLAASDAERVTDALVNVVKLGKGEPAELAQSIGRVIPVASQMGIRFEEVGAVLATLTNTGLDAAEATTALRGIMTQLLSPTVQAADILAALGTSAGDLREQIKQRGLIPVMQELMGAIGGNEEAVATLFPEVRGMIGVMAAFGNQSEQTRENLAAMNLGLGATDAAFAEVAQTASSKVKLALNDLRVVGIELGSTVLPLIADAAAGVLPYFEDLADWIRAHREDITQTFRTGAEGVKDLTLGLKSLALGLTAANSPMAALAAQLLPALVALLDALVPPLTDIATTVGPALGETLGGIAQAAGAVLVPALEALTALIEAQPAIVYALVAAWAAFKVGQIVIGLYLMSQGLVAMALGATTATAATIALRTALITTGIGAIVIGLATAAYLLYANWDKIAPVLMRVQRAIEGGVATAFRTMRAVVIGTVSEIVNFLQANWPLIVGFLAGGPIGLALVALYKWRDEVMDFFEGLVDAAFDWGAGIMEAVAAGIASAAMSPLRRLAEFAKKATDILNIYNWVFGSNIVEVYEKAGDEAGLALANALDFGLSGVPDAVEGHLLRPLELARDAVESLHNELGRLLNLPTLESAAEDLKLAELRLRAHGMEPALAQAEADRQRQLDTIDRRIEELQGTRDRASDMFGEFGSAAVEAMDAELDQLQERRKAIEDNRTAVEREHDALQQQIEAVQHLADERRLERDVLRARGVVADRTLTTDFQLNQAARTLIDTIGRETGKIREQVGVIWTQFIPSYEAARLKADSLAGKLDKAAGAAGGAIDDFMGAGSAAWGLSRGAQEAGSSFVSLDAKMNSPVQKLARWVRLLTDGSMIQGLQAIAQATWDVDVVLGQQFAFEFARQHPGVTTGRQHGGRVLAGMPYLVGEKRPEVFVPGASGTILPSITAGFRAMLGSLTGAMGALGGRGGGGFTLRNLGTITVYANDPGEFAEKLEAMVAP